MDTVLENALAFTELYVFIAAFAVVALCAERLAPPATASGGEHFTRREPIAVLWGVMSLSVYVALSWDPEQHVLALAAALATTLPWLLAALLFPLTAAGRRKAYYTRLVSDHAAGKALPLTRWFSSQRSFATSGEIALELLVPMWTEAYLDVLPLLLADGREQLIHDDLRFLGPYKHRALIAYLKQSLAAGDAGLAAPLAGPGRSPEAVRTGPACDWSPVLLVTR
jgi:hypothetical protein